MKVTMSTLLLKSQSNMLEKDIHDKRKARHHITQEDFTPDSIVDMMLKKLPKDTFSNFNKTVLDNSCGIGNFLVEILKRRLKITDIQRIQLLYYLLWMTS